MYLAELSAYTHWCMVQREASYTCVLLVMLWGYIDAVILPIENLHYSHTHTHTHTKITLTSVDARHLGASLSEQ